MSRHTGSSSWPFVHEIAVRLRHQLLDALLARREHELLELAMRGEQRFRGRRFERHAALGADDGVAEMNAAADAERRRRATRASRSAPTGDIARPSSSTGRPFSNEMTCRSGSRGFVNASFDSTHALSGMLPVEVSVSLPPMVTPHRPRLIEYAAPKGGTGRLRFCRYSSSSWRLNALSRTGASTSRSGASVRSATSKRT